MIWDAHNVIGLIGCLILIWLLIAALIVRFFRNSTAGDDATDGYDPVVEAQAVLKSDEASR